MSELPQSLENLTRDVSDLVARIRADLNRLAADADAAQKRARQKARDVYRETSARIEREPVQAAVVAFAVGCALGLLFTARSTRRR